VGSVAASISGSHNLITSSSVELPPDTITSDPKLNPANTNGGSTLTCAQEAISDLVHATHERSMDRLISVHIKRTIACSARALTKRVTCRIFTCNSRLVSVRRRV
jgi:hypothetical protein